MLATLSPLDKSIAFRDAVARELAELDYQHRALFTRCAKVTRNEVVAYLATKAKELGFAAMSEEMPRLSVPNLVTAGRMIASDMFARSNAASYDVPRLTTWAALNSNEAAEILRALWVGKLIC